MIINHKNLRSVREHAHDATIALRFGCYDILHSGHQEGIDFARAQADILVLGVMPDKYVTKEKGVGRPLKPETARVEAIDQARGVDYSFIAPANRLGLARAIYRLRPDVYVEEDEHAEKHLKALFLGSIGVALAIDHWSRIGSSSSIIASLGVQEAMAASSLLYETPVLPSSEIIDVSLRPTTS